MVKSHQIPKVKEFKIIQVK